MFPSAVHVSTPATLKPEGAPVNAGVGDTDGWADVVGAPEKLGAGDDDGAGDGAPKETVEDVTILKERSAGPVKMRPGTPNSEMTPSSHVIKGSLASLTRVTPPASSTDAISKKERTSFCTFWYAMVSNSVDECA